MQIDFGACATCFDGSPRFLEIAVQPTGGSTYTTLSPRQPVNATPYAMKSMNAANATTADGLSVGCVSCVTSSQILSVTGSTVTGTIPVASVPTGSGNYVQNTTSPPQSASFNVTGSGTAGGILSAATVNARNYFSIAGLRVLTGNGPFNDEATVFTQSNTFAGDGAGLNTVPDAQIDLGSGKFNAFFGSHSGKANTAGFAISGRVGERQ